MRLIKVLSISILSLISTVVLAKVTDVPIAVEKMTKKESKLLSEALESLNKSSSQCHFEVNDFKDARQNKKTVSMFVNATEVDKWLKSVKSNFDPVASDKKGKINIQLTPKLTRLYAYPESMNINGVSAVMVDFSVDGKLIDTKHYRGFYSKTNWANGDKEYITTLNYAMNDLVVNFIRDLSTVCQSASDNS